MALSSFIRAIARLFGVRPAKPKRPRSALGRFVKATKRL